MLRMEQYCAMLREINQSVNKLLEIIILMCNIKQSTKKRKRKETKYFGLRPQSGEVCSSEVVARYWYSDCNGWVILYFEESWQFNSKTYSCILSYQYSNNFLLIIVKSVIGLRLRRKQWVKKVFAVSF